MLLSEIIGAKRDGNSLDDAAVARMVGAIADGSASDGQIGAFAMAVRIVGMSHAECVALTGAMARSGEILDWAGVDLPGPRLDKHSTGGVGDKVSLLLAPLLAACGACVPMISGRGLGHTGGTLDKLEAIPGYRVAVGNDELVRVVRDAGCAIVGAGPRLAPADRRLYAIRDVTATVDSVPLIVASILAKKLAAGLDGLMMDVKAGSGAFAPTMIMAETLARAIVDVGNGAGLPTEALITDMSQVLGGSAGNALEVAEVAAALGGRAALEPRLAEVVLALGARLLVTGGLARDEADARVRLTEALGSGAAADRFGSMVSALGGPADIVERTANHLPVAPIVIDVAPERPGHVVTVDVRALGIAIVELGGGRATPADRVDPAVGFDAIAGPGAVVDTSRPLLRVHARRDDDAARAAARVRAAYRVGERAPSPPGPVLGCVVGAPPLGDGTSPPSEDAGHE